MRAWLAVLAAVSFLLISIGATSAEQRLDKKHARAAEEVVAVTALWYSALAGGAKLVRKRENGWVAEIWKTDRDIEASWEYKKDDPLLEYEFALNIVVLIYGNMTSPEAPFGSQEIALSKTADDDVSLMARQPMSIVFERKGEIISIKRGPPIFLEYAREKINKDFLYLFSLNIGDLNLDEKNINSEKKASN